MILPAVIFAAPHEVEKLAVLQDYCRWLDGTELHVVRSPEPKGLVYPGISNWAYKQCCKEMRGQPWVYVECDSIPLKRGWLEAISRAYGFDESSASFHGQFLWADKFSPPHDRIGGIGVAPWNADEVIPDGIVHDGFDGWLLAEHPELIAGTPLIRHSHSLFYPASGKPAEPHRFPRDWGIIGDEAVLFHADKHQDIPVFLRQMSDFAKHLP